MNTHTHAYIYIHQPMMLCLPPRGTPPPPKQQSTWPTAHTAHSAATRPQSFHRRSVSTVTGAVAPIRCARATT